MAQGALGEQRTRLCKRLDDGAVRIAILLAVAGQDVPAFEPRCVLRERAIFCDDIERFRMRARVVREIDKDELEVLDTMSRCSVHKPGAGLRRYMLAWK